MPRIDTLISHLQGSNGSLEEACADLGFDRESLTAEELEEIDNWLFQCDCCGWWFDIAERSCSTLDNVCVNCAPSGSDGEDC